jgi:hypothetical protein
MFNKSVVLAAEHFPGSNIRNSQNDPVSQMFQFPKEISICKTFEFPEFSIGIC